MWCPCMWYPLHHTVHMVSPLSISIIILSLTIRPVSVMSSPHSLPGCPSKIAVHRQSECAHFTEVPWDTVCCHLILSWKSAQHDVPSWHVRKQCSPKDIHTGTPKHRQISARDDHVDHVFGVIDTWALPVCMLAIRIRHTHTPGPSSTCGCAASSRLLWDDIRDASLPRIICFKTEERVMSNLWLGTK
jgi:hypothetical protein